MEIRFQLIRVCVWFYSQMRIYFISLRNTKKITFRHELTTKSKLLDDKTNKIASFGKKEGLFIA